ncbi:MAG: hypothetical protein IJ434_03505 [Alistipes sp.]|nr:hypothetical protein [Alistipes sp.]
MDKTYDITFINDYEANIKIMEAGESVVAPFNKYANEVKKGLAARALSVCGAHGGNYSGGMVWRDTIPSEGVLLLLHSRMSDENRKIQKLIESACKREIPIIILSLDGTPLSGVWELLLAEYKLYNFLKYNHKNPNETILEIEKYVKGLKTEKVFDELIRGVLSPMICVVSICIAIIFFIKGNILWGLICLFVVPLVIVSSFLVFRNTLREHRVRVNRPKPIVRDEGRNVNVVEYKCFIAGSTTINMERDAVRASFGQVYNKWKNLGIMVSAFTFEDFDNNHQQQMRYDEFIRSEADFVIVIIADGIGSKTIGEYRLAVSTLQENKKRPKVVVYADEKSKNDPTVVEFKKEVERNQTYWVSYSTLNELKEKVQNEMTKQLLPIIDEKMKSGKS